MDASTRLSVHGAVLAAAALAALCVHIGAVAQDAPVAAAPAEAAPVDAAPEAAPAPKETVTTVPVTLPEDDDGTVHLEEVIVTSSKRAKSQRDLPGSVGALRGEDLEKMHAQGMKDYLKLVPGVSFPDNGSPDESVPIIRGISTDLDGGATPLSTGIYLEDMPFADLFAPSSVPDLNPFDLERVEVLKGPQGTLFGSGALAGAVRYIVEKPKFGLWEAKISGTGAKVNESDAIWPTGGAALNIPIGSTFALRAVGVVRRDQGIYDMSAPNCTPALPPSVAVVLPSTLPLAEALRTVNLPIVLNGQQVCNGESRNDPDADKVRQWTGRLLAAWHPTERFNVSAFYFQQKTHQDDYGFAKDPSFLGSNEFPFPSPRDHEFGGGNLLLSYDFDWAKVLSSTNRMTKHNYTATHAEWGFGLGNQDDVEYVNVLRDDVRGWTQELRLSSPEGGTGMFEWLIGASYLHYGNAHMQYTFIGPDKPEPEGRDDLSSTDILQAFVYATSDQVASEKALFGEVTMRAGEHWEFTVGARRYQTGLDGNGIVCGAQIVAFFPQAAANNGCQPDTFHDKTQGLNPKFAARYVHNKHVQWYGLVAKGFQFGGVQINPPAPGFEESSNNAGFTFGPYKSSRLWNYETGLRTEWWHRRLRFDVAFFYLDWNDLQQTVAIPYLVTNVNLSVIANIGRAHSTGVESIFEVLPFAGAKWVTSVSFMNAVIDEPLAVAACGDPCPAGTRLPGSPKFQIANVASYEWRSPFFGLSLGPTLTHAYIGESPDAIPATGTIGGYTTYDARLVIAKRDTRLQPELSIGVNNLADERGVSYHTQVNNQVDGSPIDFYHFIQPRTIVANFSMRFGG